ncbi:MAG: arginine repressor [Phycisphaerales bacterium]
MNNHAVNEKHRRLGIIKGILERQRPRNQQELLALLSDQGAASTQATLSRDLRELGVLKGPDGYELPRQGQVDAREQASAELKRAIQTYVRSAKRAGNLVVIRTGPGQAAPLALEIDRAAPRDAVGTVAGDDTVFVASPSPNKAARLLRTLDGLGRS